MRPRSPIFPTTTVLFAVGLLGLAHFVSAPTLSAQDRFGAAVTWSAPDEVVVVKAGAAIGPAAAVVYRLQPDGSWAQTDRLGKLPGGFPGEALLPSVSAGGDVLIVASGDPAGREAGHLFERRGGAWTPVERVPVDPAAGAGEGLPAGGLDMATLMRLMGPPGRTVALSPEGDRLAVAGGAIAQGVVHVLARTGGSWRLEAALALEADPAGGPFGPGISLALGADRLVVGLPGQGPGGAAHLFGRGADGWSSVTVIRTDSLETDAAFGAAVAIASDRDEILVGAPGRDHVVRLTPAADGSWQRSGELTPPPGLADAPLGFGAVVALDAARLVVGAPMADARRGGAFAFERTRDGWTRGVGLAAGDLERSGFGSAVALHGDRALVGAPDAWGGRGRAAIFDLAAGDGPVWLEAGAELQTVTGSQPVTCSDGEAAGFACESVDLVSFLPLSAMGAAPAERITDVWGWTDPETGREYALAGRTAGLAFVDITEPSAPRFVGLLAANPSGARDIKVYRDHAFLTGDGAGDHGLLVFDLTRLRDVTDVPTTFEPDARYDEVASAHNLVIDTESGFAYTVGTNTGGQSCGGGLHMIDIRDPLQPSFAGCYTDTEGLIWSGRTHDAQCTVYRGPDEAYQGRQICFAANETAMRIVDVTDKANPQPIATASHPGTAYVHQGWLTEDHRYLYVNDELDEIVGTADRTRTLIYDVAELDDPILIGEHLGPDQATDHNLYISGTRAYLANYQAGFRVLDISDPEHPVEIGWFDTTPYGENPPGFLGGAWTAWPFFESGMIVVSSMNEGLFIVRPQQPIT